MEEKRKDSVKEFNDENMRWKVLSSRKLIERPWMNVRVDRAELPNGTICEEYYVLHYPTWVNVIAITEDGEFILERQYRHGIGRVSTEICAGCAEDGEDPLTAAKRELWEETGYTDGKWTELMVTCPNSGSTDNLCHSFLAEGVKKVSGQHLDRTEDIHVFLCSREETFKMLQNGEFLQAMMIAPMWKYFAMNNKAKE